jgi:hypothetical protein
MAVTISANGEIVLPISVIAHTVSEPPIADLLLC